MIALQPRLLEMPMAGLMPMGLSEANRLLTLWEHSLGVIERPFGQVAYALEILGEPISLAVSASTTGEAVTGKHPKTKERIHYRRGQVVELARLCSAPGYSWATRIMLRLWREVCARKWPYWPVTAAASYSENAKHKGEIYRADGWLRVNEDCGFVSGSNYGRAAESYAAIGKKTLWLWPYEVAA